MVLWGVTLLALLAGSMAATGGMAAKRSLNMVEADQARARLDEALAAAVLALERPQKPWRADGKSRRLALDGATAEIRIVDEAGRADLNRAPPALLQSLLRRIAGEEGKGDWLANLLAARAAQRPLVTVAELAGLPEMTAALYQRLAFLVTVHNPSGKIDWRTADPSLLAAVPGLSEGQVATLVAGRSESDYSPDQATAEAMTRAGVLADPSSVGDIRVMTFSISLSLDGGGRASAEALVRLRNEGDPVEILEWRSPAGNA